MPARRPGTLFLLVLIVAFGTLVALVALSAFALRGERASVAALGCGLPLAVLLLLAAVVALVEGGGAAALPLPVGPPGLAGALALDPVGLAFLVPLAVLAGAAFAVAEPACAAPLLAGFAATLLALIAGDAFLLALAVGLAMGLSGGSRRAVAVMLPLAAAAALAPHAGLLQGDAFAALRAARGPGAAPGAALVFPCGIAAGFVLLWPGAADAEARPGVAVFRDPARKLLGLFLLFRLVFDLGAQPAPVPAALALLLLGAGGALLAGWDAAVAPDLARVVAALGTVSAMLGAASAGVALLARAVDLAPVASAGAAGAYLAAATVVVAEPLALLVVQSVREQAGSVRLAWLGGLAGTMPRTALAFALAAGSLASLPPLAGFATFWLATGALLAASHGGEPGLPVLLAVVLAGLGLAVALACAAALRAGAVVFLGRPRTPRGAAAAETRRALLHPMVALGAVLLVLSLGPGSLLRLASPLLRAVAGAPHPIPVLALASPTGEATYSPLLVALLLGVIAALPVVAGRRLGLLRASREVATWDGGAAPPPDWLPFGEPLAQANAALFARGLKLPRLAPTAAAPTASARLARRGASWWRAVAGRWRLPGTLPPTLMPALVALLAVLLLAGGEAGWL